jgi:hypothetical protein
MHSSPTPLSIQNGLVIRNCLEAVDEAQPWFICILGQRYGWSFSTDPDSELLKQTFDIAAESYPWVNQFRDRSVTELEVLHGYLNKVSGLVSSKCSKCSDKCSESILTCLFPPSALVHPTTTCSPNHNLFTQQPLGHPTTTPSPHHHSFTPSPLLHPTITPSPHHHSFTQPPLLQPHHKSPEKQKRIKFLLYVREERREAEGGDGVVEHASENAEAQAKLTDLKRR